jgi:hypothetical protein
MADVETTDFEALPASTYVCRITDAEEGVTSESSPKAPNEDYIRWEFTVASGEHEGRKFWTNTLLNHQKSKWVLKGLLIATGFFTAEQFDSGDIDFRTYEEQGGDGPVLLGTLVKVRVDRKKREDNDEYQNNIKAFKKVSEEEADALDLMP